MAVTEDAGERNRKHDESYKDILSDKYRFLHFLMKYIAKSWTANISADDMERVDKSFITKEYGHIDSDLIYRLKINDSDVYFYVLIELQSKVDFTMPFRLLRYMVALLNDIFKNTDENVRERKDFRLPAIVPIVLYDGKDSWTAAMTYREYTEDYGIFGDNVIDFRYLLFDLNRTDEQAIAPAEGLLDVVFLTYKLLLEKKMSQGTLLELLREQALGLSKDDKNTLVNWMEQVVIGRKMRPEIKESLKNFLEKGDKAIMVETWADQLVDEGKKRKALEIAKAMRDKGIDVDTISELTKLTIDDVLKL